MTLTSVEDSSVFLDAFPVQMQNSALVLKDEDDGSVITELEGLSSSETSLTPAAINVENSSDVIIGPVTQFHGPVTIYQNVTPVPATERVTNGSANSFLNGKLVKSESTSSETTLHTEKPKRNFLLYSKHLRYVGIFLVLVIIVVSVASVIILSTKTETPPSTETIEPTDNRVTTRPFTGPLAIIPKTIWGGRSALNFTKPLLHPTLFVIISHTVTPFCKDFQKCSERVKSIQAYHVSELKSPDVGYNFLIGGDGNAYVGRGWDIKNFHGSLNSIGISFIGDYIYDELTPHMINVTKKLLKEGVEKGKLAKDYKLVGHNQTFNTLSPGPHVYEVIKTWPHFDLGIYYR